MGSTHMIYYYVYLVTQGHTHKLHLVFGYLLESVNDSLTFVLPMEDDGSLVALLALFGDGQTCSEEQWKKGSAALGREAKEGVFAELLGRFGSAGAGTDALDVGAALLGTSMPIEGLLRSLMSGLMSLHTRLDDVE